MNFEEGFRRIGIVIWVIAFGLGTIAFAMNLYGAAIAITGGVLLVGYGLLYATAYVARGFMKTGESKNEDQAL